MTTFDVEEALRAFFPFGFPLSKKSWAKYEVALLLPEGETAAGSDIFRLRQLAFRVNQDRVRSSYVREPIHAGQLATVGLIQDVLRFLLERYCHEQSPGAMAAGLEWIGRRSGAPTIKQTPQAFVELFPPQAVARGTEPGDVYLAGSSTVSANREAPNRDVVAGETLLLALASLNRAFRPFHELFDDIDLQRAAPYLPLVKSLDHFFAAQPPVDDIGLSLPDALRGPMEASPDSLEGQLDFIKSEWGHFLPDMLNRRIAIAANILKEEDAMRGFGPGEVRVLEFGAGTSELGYPEPAAFSRDADWMSNVVLLAKSTYVWLDQLSKWYGRPIRHLSDVPDEELDRLARWGFSGLWLIGLWERSRASQKIKQMMGNPDAVASAYSLYDYVIAADLGGEDAYQNLRERAWRRGIRLASDMVPNHVGLDSKWVIEHPDWFVQSPFPPFPVYQFNGPNLSEDDRAVIQIEDGYWDQRDAAVVFKREDRDTGEARFIYHGNDGTNMPWNDTAQLNFLLPHVREAVVQTVLHVARKFSIIRFDAAMTLAKRHYQRLWFPKPGEGGAIPSRAEHGMSQAEFDAVFPKEFWREVVDRVAAEVPDTLLLAEAFWLMEGYFVRTLGMHRVYNSAFMNMLKTEDNAKYRQTVKNVLEFSPEVLKRFVNFMNNPDEDTAIAQFGDGDKYIGVALLMVTMPGLPMFGHGQVEGFTEKYGMEYRKAYWDEQIDQRLVSRHEAEIFPLMRRRRLFSGAENFVLFDFVNDGGWVDENVFAYANRAGDDRALILFNNAYDTTSGRVTMSTAINVGSSDAPQLERRTLGQALALRADDRVLYAFCEHKTGLRYLRPGRQLVDEGFHATLGGYQYQALIDFREIHDADGSWTALAQRLGGRGVPNLDEAYREMRLEPVLAPLGRLLDADALRNLADGDKAARRDFAAALPTLLTALRDQIDGAEIPKTLVADIVEAVTEIGDTGAPESIGPVLVAAAVARGLGRLVGADETGTPAEIARHRLDDMPLGKTLERSLAALRADDQAGRRDALLVRLLVSHGDLLTTTDEDVWTQALADPAAQEFLQVNRHEGEQFLSKENLEELVYTLLAAAGEDAAAEKSAARVLDAAAGAGYRVAKIPQLL